ncbi:MAG: IMP cyclohydrolase [Oscillospiraceae bacterium]|jgi:IMP cyclohydrolase|nr:IMP cyclohydrolase [Oscillospiraceae bacterium]
MEITDIKDELMFNPYPGRGIIIGKGQDAKQAVIAYFIMGRSENSRNRIFAQSDHGIKTQAFDPAKLVDPSLIIYSPVRVLGSQTIVTNGDQTDTVYDFLKRGETFEKALRTRTFEPDAPNFTPRISGIVCTDKEFSYKLSILKSACGEPSSSQRFFFEYSEPKSGQGHFIHTYKCDGDPIPSFEGEPKLVEIKGDIEEFSNLLWYSLNDSNKVSLFVRFINLETGEYETKIINKNVR